ncbi:MAG: ABC transporter permease [Candidatus Aminicenantes bacterium]|nr:ABC transporter permease [Candidatus Aminicenantes bacterium]
MRYPDGKPVFKVLPLDDDEEGRRRLKNRDADLMIVIPAGFSRSVAAYGKGELPSGPVLANVGDETSVRFMVAAAFADYASYGYIAKATGSEMPEVVRFESLGGGRSPNDFELYVPALLVLAVIMVLFTAAASIIKEVDKETITRLTLSELTTFEFLGAVSLNQMLIGTFALGLTYVSAVSVGFESRGSLVLLLLVGAVSTLSVVAIGLLVAGFIRTIFELLTVGVFPFFVLMFFSDCMFPMPKIILFRLAGHAFHVTDILPTALTTRAFGRILSFDAGLGDVAFELAAIVLLTILYFGLGLAFFRRRHLRAR